MSDKLLALLEAVRDVPDDVEDVRQVLEEVPAVGALPEPQVSWTLLGLIHYRRRKGWAWRVLDERLHGQHSRGFQEGVVPGLPDWTYQLDHGNSHLIHRGTGEDIHIDAENGPELILGNSFIDHFQSHREPG